MKQRGRHRRRRRGAALRAVLAGTALALTAAATLISASQATVADDPGALKPLSSSAGTGALRLQEHPVPARSLDRLSSAMGGPVGVGTVLRSADRTLRESADCGSEERESLPVAPVPTTAYCWDPADTAATGWRPASVTTSGDADDDGLWGTDRVILAGWTHSTTSGPVHERGLARVAFVDADHPRHPSYRWVLLVVPVDEGRDYRGLTSPVSGMAWYGDKLLVTSGPKSAEALYVYDLNRIQRTSVDGPAVGRVPGGWSADGYGYVMPAVASYRFTAGRCAGTEHAAPCPGSLSLDRGTSPDSLVVAERTPAGGDRQSRLWRYSLSAVPAHGGPLATDAAGRVDAVDAYRTGAADIRGVLSYHPVGAARPTWYIAHPPRDLDGHGTLWAQDADGARSARCGSDATRHCWAEEAGSLSYWPQTGEVWSVTDRMLFSLPLTAIDSSLG
ncbi:hypothetical protein ACFY0F_19470 [Streptomyces sp. NPDC001544]|uniref:hypothetical protein n=1 Tax=Streptomyces sp. NPDC001544 TaxID=3364584 RepID=UPI0036B8BB7C